MATYRVPTLNNFEWQQSVHDKDTLTPPGSPTKGDRYIVGGTGVAGWSGYDQKIVYYDGASWVADTPLEGWVCWVEDENKFYHFTGSVWALLPVEQAQVVGLTSADGPTFAHLHLTTTIMCGSLTDGYIPYHVSDAAGLANSPIYTDGTNVGIGIITLPPVALLQVGQRDSTAKGMIAIGWERNTFLPSTSDDGYAHIFVSDGTSGGDFGGEAGHLILQPRVHASVYRDIIFASGLTTPVARMVITGEGNVLIGATSCGTSAAKVLAMASGTAPTTSPADMAQIWVADFAPGNACPYFRTENGTVIGLNQSLLTTDTLTFAHMTGELDAREEIVNSESTIRYPLLIQEAEVDTTTILTKTGTTTGITNKTFVSPVSNDLLLSGQAMLAESSAAVGKLNYATDAGREAVGGQALEVVVKSQNSATYHRMILDNRQDCVVMNEIISYTP